MLLTLVVNLRLRDSRLGRAWLALREDEEAAASAGIPLMRTKLLAYGTGAGLGGLSGAFLASYLNTVTAVQFEFSFSIFVLAMVVVGGLGSIWGVVGGAVVLSAINSYVLPDLLGRLPGRLGLDFDLSQVSYGIYGVLLVIMVLIRPAGLWPDARAPDDALFEAGPQSGGRTRAPGRLAYVQAFANSFFDLEERWGEDRLGTPAGLGRWLQARGVPPAGSRTASTRERWPSAAACGRSSPSTTGSPPIRTSSRRSRRGHPPALRLRARRRRRLTPDPAVTGVADALGLLVAIVHEAQLAGTWTA